jgi:predicted amidophosphoribosyltransferase
MPQLVPVSVRFPGLRVRAASLYEGSLRSAILATKDGRRDVADALGLFVAGLIGTGAILLPVPTTRKRRRVRGFDGVERIALRAAELAGARVTSALTQRAGGAQHGRSRRERIAARGRFACNASIAGSRVVLLDDVCTTGSTLLDCAAAVRDAGGFVEEAVVVAVSLREAGYREEATKSVHPWKKPNG